MERFEVEHLIYYKDLNGIVKKLPIGTIVFADPATGSNLTGVSDEFGFPPADYSGQEKYVVTIPDGSQKILVSKYFLFPYPETEVTTKKTNYWPYVIGAGILALIAYSNKKPARKKRRT